MATYPIVYAQLAQGKTVKRIKSLFPAQSYDAAYLAAKVSQFQLVTTPADVPHFAALEPDEEES